MQLKLLIISLVLWTVQAYPFQFPTEETEEQDGDEDEEDVNFGIASPLVETNITEYDAFEYLVKFGYANDTEVITVR